MSRLLDHIFDSRIAWVDKAIGFRREHVMEIINNNWTACYNCDDVERYIHAVGSQIEGVPMKNVMPPHDMQFMEYRLDPNVTLLFSRDEGRIRNIGCITFAQDWEDDCRIVSFVTMTMTDNARIIVVPSILRMMINRDGTPLEYECDNKMEELGIKDETMMRIIMPFVLGMSFCNCKNIELVRMHSRKLPKNYIRYLPADRKVQFKTINVFKPEDRAKLKIIKEQNIGGWTNSLHMCRGHFRKATTQFGHDMSKHDQWWIPQHWRGSIEAGYVDKDYRVGGDKNRN
jgi:hypothetical protein